MKFLSTRALAALLVLLAATAFATASASAAECKHTTGSTTLCIENKPTTGEVPFTATLKKNTDAIFKEAGITWDCVAATDHGALHATGGLVLQVTNRVIEFSGCDATSPAHCQVQSPIRLGEGEAGLNGEVSVSSKIFSLDAFPATGTKFGTVTWVNHEGTCLIAGTLKITSELDNKGEGPVCTLPLVASEATEHELECHGGSSSHLKLGEEVLELKTTESIALSGANAGKKWSLWEQ